MRSGASRSNGPCCTFLPGQRICTMCRGVSRSKGLLGLDEGIMPWNLAGQSLARATTSEGHSTTSTKHWPFHTGSWGIYPR